MSAKVLTRGRMVLGCAAAFVGTFAVCVTLLASQQAVAKNFRVSSVGCHADGTPGLATMYSQGMGNMDTGHIVDLYCPVPDSDYFAHSSVAILNVHGWDNSSNASGTTGRVMSQACVTFYGSNSGSCGGIVSTGSAFVGMYALSPYLTTWQNPSYVNEFAYLWVRLPPGTGPLAVSSLSGFYMST